MRTLENTQTVLSYAQAVVDGMKDGVMATADMLAHPIDQMLVPLCQLASDAVLVTLDYAESQVREPDAQTIIKKSAEKAWQNMYQRCDNLKDAVHAFKIAPNSERARILSEMTTCVFLPGFMIKAAQGVVNLERLGSVNPAIYKQRSALLANLKMAEFEETSKLSAVLDTVKEKIGLGFQIEPAGIDLISSINAIRELSRKSCVEFSYVIMPNGEFRAILADLGGHHKLTGGKPIAMGGDIVAENGRIIKVDNRTGDYTPYLESNVIRHVFNKMGATEINMPGVIQETYSKASSHESHVRRYSALALSKPHPIPSVLELLSITEERMQIHSSVLENLFINPAAASDTPMLSQKNPHFTQKEIDSLPRFANLASKDAASADARRVSHEEFLRKCKTGYCGSFLWVVDQHNQFILGDYYYGNAQRQKHPWLVNGRPVLAAGEMKIENGVVVWACNSTGHYKTKGPHQEELLRQHLSKLGITLKEFRFEGNSDQLDLNHPPKNMMMLCEPNPVFRNSGREKKLYREANTISDAQNNQSAIEAQESLEKMRSVLQSKNSYYFSLTQAERDQFKNTAETLFDLHNATNQVATFATRLGGHSKMWSSVTTCTAGLATISMNLNALASCEKLFTLSSFANGLGIINAGLSIADALFGSSDDNDNGIMEAFQQVMAVMARVHEEILSVKKILIQNMESVFIHLNQINGKLDRLERIMTSSFKELHLTECINDIDRIKKDINKEMVLTDSERKECLTRLSTWIEHHLFSGIQTLRFRESQDTAKCIEILMSDDFDSATMFPFLMMQLRKYIPSTVMNIDDIIPNLCNLQLYQALSDVYVTAVTTYSIPANNYTPSLQRMAEKIKSAQEAIENVRDTKIIWGALINRYHKARFDVGRAIKKAYDDMPGGVADNVPLGMALPNSASKELLLEKLHQMELIRVLLFRLIELTAMDDPSLLNKIKELESKNAILEKPKSFYDAMRNGLIASIDKSDAEFKACIINGADINIRGSYDAQAIHHILRLKSNPQVLLHFLFQCGDELEYTHRALDYYGNMGFGSWVNPERIMRVRNLFQATLLFIANGCDINPGFNSSQDRSFFFDKSTPTNWGYIIQKYIIREFNLKKTELQKAYDYYRAVENGHLPSDVIDANCLLWICCVLGNLDILKSISHAGLNAAQSIAVSGFSPIMMALVCGNRDVVEWLINNGGLVSNAKFATTDPNLYDELSEEDGYSCRHDCNRTPPLSDDNLPHLLFLAIEYKQFEIANQLIRAGVVPTHAQKTAIHNASALMIKATTSYVAILISPRESDALVFILATIESLKNAIREIALRPDASINSGETTDQDDDDILQEQTKDFFKSDPAPTWEKRKKHGERVLRHVDPKLRLRFLGALKKERDDVTQKIGADGSTEIHCQLATVVRC